LVGWRLAINWHARVGLLLAISIDIITNICFLCGPFSAKIHEEDYRRETQINVPNLGPEILAVFANSQIFQDHQPTKLNRISTKTYLAGIHSPNREMPTTPRLSDQDRLLRRLEGNDGPSGAHTPLLGGAANGKSSGKSTRSSSIVSSGVPKVKFYLN